MRRDLALRQAVARPAKESRDGDDFLKARGGDRRTSRRGPPNPIVAAPPRRPCNGAGFVYFAMELFQSDGGDREEALVDYVHQVLDALGCRHGPSHAEVMWLDGDDEPCLVEVGCRPHGGEGTFVDMVQPIMGHSQLSVMLDAVERPYRFHRLPKRPPRFSGGAFEVCLVAHEAGTLKGLPGLDAIRALPSYLSEESARRRLEREGSGRPRGVRDRPGGRARRCRRGSVGNVLCPIYELVKGEAQAAGVCGGCHTLRKIMHQGAD